MTADRRTAWEQAANVLAVRLDTIGDVLMTTPAIRALAEARPGAQRGARRGAQRGRRITLLTSAPGAEAAALVPEIAETIVYDAPWLKATAPRVGPEPEYAMAERLRHGGYDAAVIFTVYSQNPLPSAMLCYLAGIPLRLAHCHENPYQLLTDFVPDPEPATLVRHEVQRQLDLVATVGAVTGDTRLSLAVPPPARERVDVLLERMGVDVQRWAVIHPGATAASRRYSPAGFAAVARTLVAKHGFQVVFTGSTGEVPLVDSIRALTGVPTLSLAGCLDLAEMAALIEQAPVLISNNSGPVHVAAAVGTPVVDLYALTNPQHTPWQVPSRVLYHDVPCKFCYKSVCPLGHHDCLRLVEPREVVAAALDLVEASEQPGAAAAAGAAPALTALAEMPS